LAFDRTTSRRFWWFGMSQLGRFLGELRRRQFDLVIDLQGLLRSGLMAMATGADRRGGLSTAREGARWCYTDIVPVADFGNIHAVDRYWLVARALGISGDPPPFHLTVSEAARVWAEEALRDLPRPLLMVGPGSRWLTKRWPPEHFAALIN